MLRWGGGGATYRKYSDTNCLLEQLNKSFDEYSKIFFVTKNIIANNEVGDSSCNRPLKSSSVIVCDQSVLKSTNPNAQPFRVVVCSNSEYISVKLGQLVNSCDFDCNFLYSSLWTYFRFFVRSGFVGGNEPLFYNILKPVYLLVASYSAVMSASVTCGCGIFFMCACVCVRRGDKGNVGDEGGKYIVPKIFCL
jgi:hypothetical protein